MYYDNVAYQIQVTNDCFVKCSYCMTADSNLRKQKAEPGIVRAALNASKGFKEVYLVFLGGEPLMVGKKWFQEAFAIADTSQAKLRKRIYTNGLLLDDEWHQLLKANKCQVVVSYDGLGNGAKGTKRAYDKLCRYSDIITYASMTLSADNYTGLLDTYKQVTEAGVKRFALQFDIYATSEQMKAFGQEVVKLFKYIEENPGGAKFSTYTDAKAVVTGVGKTLSNEFETPVLNNDYCVRADGEITLGVPDALDPEWTLGNIYSISHINEVVFTERMAQLNRDYIQSLDLLGELSEVNRLTHGGGFFFDKKGIMPMNRPNMTKLHAYREILNYFSEVPL